MEAKKYTGRKCDLLSDIRLEYVSGFLPPSLFREIRALLSSLRSPYCELEEIRLRRCGQSSLTLAGRNVPLFTRVDSDAFDLVLGRICADGIYAFKTTMQRGYVPLDYGIRCALVGSLRYDGERASGVAEVSSLTLRLPLGSCSFASEILEKWKGSNGGLLIASPPLGGKTTALRSIARLLGSGKNAKRVALIDQRGEFFPPDFSGTLVDLFKGYRRSCGTEIAIRTMAAEVIVIDEIGDVDDVDALLYASRSGVSVVASAHAESFSGAIDRELLLPLFDRGVFSSVAVLEKNESGRGFSFFNINEMGGKIC